MNIAWIAILPVALLTVILSAVLIIIIAKYNNKNSHTTIDPKPTENFTSKEKEESQ